MQLGDAPSQRPTGTLNLPIFPHPRLHEHRQQHDPPTRSDPLSDPHRLSIDVEPQLPKFPVELPRVRLTKKRPSISEKIDIERHRGELLGR
jgi:hypothetical protein